MKELVVFCEGPTEQGFCRQVLQPYLFPGNEGLVYTLPVGRKNEHHVYGITKYQTLNKFIKNTLSFRNKSTVRFTSLIDLYGLPDDFPGKSDSTRNPADPYPYVVALEEAFGQDIGDPRFIPHLQLHEFETMLFAKAEAFRIAFERCDDAIDFIDSITQSFPSVEHINDGRDSSPSKRIISVLPAYAGRKASAGPDIAEHIGINAIRATCRHFDAWLTRLENLDWD